MLNCRKRLQHIATWRRNNLQLPAADNDDIIIAEKRKKFFFVSAWFTTLFEWVMWASLCCKVLAFVHVNAADSKKRRGGEEGNTIERFCKIPLYRRIRDWCTSLFIARVYYLLVLPTSLCRRFVGDVCTYVRGNLGRKCFKKK